MPCQTILGVLLSAEVKLMFLQLLYACCKVCVFALGALLCEGWKRRLVCFLSCIFFFVMLIVGFFFFFELHTHEISFVDRAWRAARLYGLSL